MKSLMKTLNSNGTITLAWIIPLLILFVITGCGNMGKSNNEGEVIEPDPALSISVSEITPGACNSSEINLVIHASVMDEHGDPVTDLTEQDVTILNDNAPVDNLSIEWKAITNSPFAATLLMDYSDSMKPKTKEKMVAAAKLFVNSLENQSDKGNPNVVEIIKFAQYYEVMAGFTENEEALLEAINREPKKDILTGTSLYDVLHQAITDTAKRPERRFIVLLSDGLDRDSQYISKKQQKELVDFAKGKDIRIFTISPGKTTPIGQNVLEYIAEETSGHFLHSPETSELSDIYANLSKHMKSQYVIECTVDGSAPDKSTLTMEVTDPRGMIASASREYTPCPLPPAIAHSGEIQLTNSASESLTAFDIHGLFGKPELAFAGVTGSRAGLKIVDLKDLSNPSVSDEISIGGDESVRDIEVVFPYLYVAGYSEGLIIYSIPDIKNNTGNHFIGKTSGLSKVTEVAVSGPYAYVMDETEGLRVIRISDPLNPQDIVRENILEAGRNLNAHNGMAYFTREGSIHEGTLHIVKASDEGTLSSMGEAQLSEQSSRNAYFSYPYLYINIPEQHGSLTAFNISQPTIPDQFEAVFGEKNSNRHVMSLGFRNSWMALSTCGVNLGSDTKIELFRVITDPISGKPDTFKAIQSLDTGNSNDVIASRLMDQSIFTMTRSMLKIYSIN